jgi:hypothetical protein
MCTFSLQLFLEHMSLIDGNSYLTETATSVVKFINGHLVKIIATVGTKAPEIQFKSTSHVKDNHQ